MTAQEDYLKTRTSIQRKIILISIFFGLLFWLIDSLIDHFFYYQHAGTFGDVLYINPPEHELYIRSVVFLLFILFGIITAQHVSKRKYAEGKLVHINTFLSAINDINHLLVIEKNPRIIIRKVCKALIETRGYKSVWVIMENNGENILTVETAYKESLEVFREEIKRGKLPVCVKKAALTSEMVITEATVEDCIGCQLAKHYTKRGGFTQRLEYDGELLGYMSVSLTSKVLSNKDEQMLFSQIISDVSIILHTIKISSKREKAEAELAKSEKRYRRLFSNLNIAAALHEIVLDDKGNPVDFIFLEANSAYEEITLLKSEEIIGKKGSEVIPNLEERWSKTYGEVALSGTSKTIVDHSEYLNKYWEVKVFSPQKFQFAVLLKDITEERNAAVKLQLSESKFRNVVQSSLLGIYIYELQQDDRLIIIDGNSAAERITGVKNDFLIGKELEEVFTKIGETDVSGKYRRAAKFGESYYDEGTEYTDDLIGGIYESYTFQIEPGKIAVMFADITDRKKSESQLKESERKLRESQTVANLGHFEFDLLSEKWTTSEQLNKILEIDDSYTKDYRGLFDLIHPEYILEAKALFSYYTKQEQNPFKREFKIVGKNSGAEKWVRVLGELQFNTEKKPVKIFGTLQDISEIKRVEIALEERILALTQPLENVKGIEFSDLFHLDDIQNLQDEFANATGVASIITGVDGAPITEPSYFCTLCKDIIRNTKIGKENCLKSDSFIGKPSDKGPRIHECMSGGLWDAGAAIKIGDKHIANWLIGQVRNEKQSEDKMREYAKEIGVDEEIFLEAFREVPSMSAEKFVNIAQMVYTLANQLSKFAFQNVQQARFIKGLKEYEEKLKENEEKLKTLFEAMTEMVVLHEIVKDEEDNIIDYRIIDCNKAFSEITGIIKKDAIGQLATEVYHTDKPPYLEEYSQVALTGKSISYTTFYAPMDKHFFISVVSPKLGQFATITTDITQIKQVEELIKSKNKELENYLYVASHDLRSPLINIQGFSQRLEDITNECSDIIGNLVVSNDDKEKFKSIFQEEIPKNLKFIFNGVEKMDKLITGLLQISRTGRINMSVRKVNMRELLDDVINTFAFEIKETGTSVEIKEIHDCYGDYDLLHQLFANLVSNAIKYRSGERVLELKISSEMKFRKIVYCVKDNGIGIDEGHLKRIWDVFFQVNPKTNLNGEGIGLSIVKRIVDKHRGKVWIETIIGDGSKFYVELNKEIFSE